MKKILFVTFILSPGLCFATPGYYGDVKVVKENKKHFLIHQAGYKLLIKKDKLPKDIIQTWHNNIGQTIESGVPYVSVQKELKIKNPHFKLPANR